MELGREDEGNKYIIVWEWWMYVRGKWVVSMARGIYLDDGI